MQKLIQLAIAKTVTTSVQIKLKIHWIIPDCLLNNILEVKNQYLPRFTEPFPERLPKSIYQALCSTLAHITAIILSPHTTENVKPWRSPEKDTRIPNHYPLLCQPQELQKPYGFKTWGAQHSSSPLLPSGCFQAPEISKQDQEHRVTNFLFHVSLPSPLIFLACCSTHPTSPGTRRKYHMLVCKGMPIMWDAFARVNVNWFCFSSLSLLLFAIIVLCCYINQLQSISTIHRFIFSPMIVYTDIFDIFIKSVQNVELPLASHAVMPVCSSILYFLLPQPSFMKGFNLPFSGFYY